MTYIVVSASSRRFAPTRAADCDGSKNVAPGLVVDTGLVHPTAFE